MYDLGWDRDTGGIVLQKPGTGEVRSKIRPVFYEELDILGFKEKWHYPRVKEPLLWATVVGRSYFYRGEYVAQAKGGSFFQAPTIQYFRDNLTLEPVDVPTMLAKNAALLCNLAHEAIDFIRYAYDRERPRVDIVAVAFSGGKDSLTLLDLMQRALQPDEYVVVFNDTQMEITPTYEAVEKAKAHWPHLRFYTSRSHKPPEQSWREFGPPSRIHRWCCSVHKTVPNLLLLRQLAQNPAARVLVYDGVRAEESSARAGYDRISCGGKHGTQINVSPILKWNAGEIFLYLFEREAFFNRAYRFGLFRVGCSVCPMASQWSEGLNWLVSSEACLPLLEVLRDYYKQKDGECNTEAITIGTWKARAGGRNILGSLKVVESRNGNLVKFTATGSACDWVEWAKTIGQVTMTESTAGVITGPSLLLHFRCQDSGGHLEVEVNMASGYKRSVLRHLRAITNKTAYCCGCKACEVECPTGALKVGDSVVIDEQHCWHCTKCLLFVAKGCLVAKSLHITGQANRELMECL
jgi:phosphoadenosine phosphosulfate reductase